MNETLISGVLAILVVVMFIWMMLDMGGDE